MERIEKGLRVKRNVFGFSSTAAPVGTGLRLTFDKLESVPFTAKEKSLPASVHDLSLIKDAA